MILLQELHLTQVFNKSQISFLGHIIDKDGIHADSQKVSAVMNMRAPIRTLLLHGHGKPVREIFQESGRVNLTNLRTLELKGHLGFE